MFGENRHSHRFRESLDARWSDWAGRWVTDETNAYLKMTTAGYADRALAVREGARALHFKYEITLKGTGGSAFDHAGPAFGIQDPAHYFTVFYAGSGSFTLGKVIDGARLSTVSSASHSPSSGDHVLRVEVTNSGGNNVATVTLDPGGGQTVPFNAVNLGTDYTGGQVGAFCWVNAERRVDDAKLWTLDTPPRATPAHRFAIVAASGKRRVKGGSTRPAAATSTSRCLTTPSPAPASAPRMTRPAT